MTSWWVPSLMTLKWLETLDHISEGPFNNSLMVCWQFRNGILWFRSDHIRKKAWVFFKYFLWLGWKKTLVKTNMRYCWWKKSCTRWYGKYPIIYKVSCRFSFVSPSNMTLFLEPLLLSPKWSPGFHLSLAETSDPNLGQTRSLDVRDNWLRKLPTSMRKLTKLSHLGIFDDMKTSLKKFHGGFTKKKIT